MAAMKLISTENLFHDIQEAIKRAYRLFGKDIAGKHEIIGEMTEELIRRRVDADNLNKAINKMVDDEVKTLSLSNIISALNELKRKNPNAIGITPPEPKYIDGEPVYVCNICLDNGIIDAGHSPRLTGDDEIMVFNYRSRIYCSCQYGQALGECHKGIIWDGESAIISNTSRGDLYVYKSPKFEQAKRELIARLSQKVS